MCSATRLAVQLLATPLADSNSEAAAEYRAGFLRAVAHLGIQASDCERLAERLTGRSFSACAPADLHPVLEHLRDVAYRAIAADATPRRACGG